MAGRLILTAILLAAPAAAQVNPTARLQTTERRSIGCNFPVPMASVAAVNYTLLFGTDADPDGMQVGSPSIVTGTYGGVTVASGQVRVLLDPDVDAIDRDGNGYRVEIIAETSGGERYSCRGALRVEDQGVAL